MANKWQIMVLGVVLTQGLGAMDSPRLNSPRLNCSTEARKMEVRAITLKKSWEKIKEEPKESFSYGYKTASHPEMEELFKRHPQMRFIPFPY